MAVLASTGTDQPSDRSVRLLIPALGLGLAAVIAATARWGPDWPAQEFRAWSAHQHGITAWTNQWYSGQALPGYSVTYPAIAAQLGAAVTGVFAVVVATLGAMRMAPTNTRYLRVGYLVSVGLVLAADLLIGQVPYLVGVAFGVWAFWALRTGRPLAAAALAALSSLSSPLAAAFLLLAIPALVSAYGWRRAASFGTAVAGLAVSVFFSGASGQFMFVPKTFLWTVAFAVLAVALPRREDRAIRILGLTYAAAAIALVVVPNPIGGNLARFGQLLALPLAWHLLPRLRWRNRGVSVLLIAGAAVWPIFPSVTSIGHGAADPSQSRAYYRGLLGFLHTQDPRSGRLEVVFTREHWESLWVAQAFPLARGWERQTDLGVNAVLYRHSLSAGAYRRWLDDNAVSLVALPNVPIDFGGQAELTLLQRPPSYLVPVWHDANWQVWRVRASQALVTGPATLRTLGAASLALDFTHAGTATVRIRGSGMWSVTRGKGCVSHDQDGWLTVQTAGPGPIAVHASVSLGALGAGPRCS